MIYTIKTTDWKKINDTKYQCVKSNNVTDSKGRVVTKIAFNFTDNSGNSMSLVNTKVEPTQITYTNDECVDVNVVATPVEELEIKDYNYANGNYPPSTYLNEDKGYIEQNFLDESGKPVVKHIKEWHNVSPTNCAVQTTYDIDKFYGVNFLAQDGTYLTEVNNMEDLFVEGASHSYYIGENNMIYGTPDLVGKYVSVDYYGMGRTIINCNRIYYRDKINGTPIILEELIGKGEDCLKALASLGSASVIIDELNKANKNAEKFVKDYGNLYGIKDKVDELNNTKITKNTGSVTMTDLSQDVKEAMTGGSVAVVGKNTVLTDNIVDKQITPPKTSFLKSLNLFDGNYLHGYYLIGQSNQTMYLNKNDNYYLIALPINANCQYSINMPEDIGKEDGKYWFKVATSTKTLEELAELLKPTGTVELDGSISYANTSTHTKNYKLTTGSNDKTLLIDISKYKTPYVEVLEGLYDKALYKSYSQGWKPYGIDVYSKDEVDSLLGGRVSISKTSDNEFNIDLGKYSTNLKHVVNSGTNSNLWNLLGIYCDGKVIVNAGTDIIGPVQELGASDFSGGVHGNEKNVTLMITCDGVVWNKETTKTANEIKVVMESEIYRVSDHTHIYNRYVEITLTRNRMRIRNNYVCVNDSVIYRATNGGLIAIPNDHLTALTMCNYISPTAPTSGGEKYRSKSNISATMFWDGGSIEVRNIIGKELDTYEGYLTTFDNETPIRNKVYFDVIKANSSGTQIRNGENILGEFEYIFN